MLKLAAEIIQKSANNCLVFFLSNCARACVFKRLTVLAPPLAEGGEKETALNADCAPNGQNNTSGCVLSVAGISEHFTAPHPNFQE